MACDIQVVVDAAQPHVLADWWAQALGWEVEPQDAAFIRQMIAAGYATDDDTTTHRGALVWTEGAAIRAAAAAGPGTAGAPDHGGRPRIYFQQVPEAKTVKNRLHLDVRAGPGSAEAEVARLTASGATVLYRGQQGPQSWVTMADPEGNEFCVT